jgi:class 3 adenylate cyclase
VDLTAIAYSLDVPLFMDIHREVEDGVDSLVAAHLSDLEVQEKYGVHYLRWWFNPSRRTVCCLVEAPSPEAATRVHVEAHAGAADKIVEVDDDVVEGFLGESVDAGLGRMVDPAGHPDGGFRTVLFTDLEGSTSMTEQLGDEEAMRVLRVHDQIVRREIDAQHGRVVKHTGDGFMAAFPTASAAVRSAMRIMASLQIHNQRIPDRPLRVRIGVSAGEPVDDGQDLFGSTVQLARRACDAAPVDGIWVTNVVRELCLGKEFEFSSVGKLALKGFAEPVQLYGVAWIGGR